MSVRCSLGHENPDGSAFCDECGEPLSSAEPTVAPVATASAPAEPVAAPADTATGAQTCPSCGASNPAGEAFCSSCGASLQGAPAAVQTPPPAPSAPSEPPQQAPASPASAPAALHARLIVEADNQEFDLSGKENVTVGREDAVSNIYPDVDLTPHGGEEGGVSRLHARIFVENGQYMVEDENSTNFTFLNRQRLASKTPTPLQDNDEVRFGRVLLRFKTS
ncbi:FHA domain-containing protein [Ktedonobacter racemifer]|uniref:FHA domain containing protein n=1 Tax=Ktedonobacter racemifer DSM 44963 TaxID=485913 RepID=D6TPB9_KTERA|nr:FHA domain-containing protein [Ktedonobacter racemifer]EFH87475.1 FHA domain containing protein [Ktedonobacter racemifer DSM 44963]